MSGIEMDETVAAVWSSLSLPGDKEKIASRLTIRPPSEGEEEAAPGRAGSRAIRATSLEMDAALYTLPQIPVATDEHEVGDLLTLEVLGEGGMGIVERARQRSLRRDVAIKRLREERRSERAAQDLLREGLIAGRLEHPNIIPVYAAGLDEEGHPLLVMKKVEGVVWKELLDDPDHPRWGGVSRDRLGYHLEILMQISHAVELAHSRGVVHRDLKPENVMIGSYGEVYVLDWGVALSLEAAHVGQIAGTPAYMAPEMVLRDDPITTRTDVYLLGAILHEILTGRPRHTGETFQAAIASILLSEPVAFPKEVPAELGEIANRATAYDPKERFATVRDFREAIAGFTLHRASNDLAASALEKLGKLETLEAHKSGHGQAPERDRVGAWVDAQRTFAECRYGFLEALRIWPESPEAKEGLERCLRRMFELELGQGNLSAAAALLHELTEELGEEACAGLEGSLREAQERQRQEQERLEELERRAEHLDPRVMATARGRLLFVYLALIAVGIVLPLAGWLARGHVLTYREHIFGAVLNVGIVGVLIVAMRGLLRHMLSRQTVAMCALLVLSFIPLRVLGWYSGIDILHETYFEILTVAILIVVFWIFIEPKLLRLMAVPAAQLTALLLAPEHLLLISILAWLLGLLWAAQIIVFAGAAPRTPPEP